MFYRKPSGAESEYRAAVRAAYLADEQTVVTGLLKALTLTASQTRRIHETAHLLVKTMRGAETQSGLIDGFLQEFALSTEEGVVLMCLAEALLRIPDARTSDALIKDKLTRGDWAAHLDHSESLLVNASTWGMLLTGRFMELDKEVASDPLALIKHLIVQSGEPLIRSAVRQAMKIMGQQFVLAETIKEAWEKSIKRKEEGFCYSYDMLGESAKTDADAKAFFRSYQHAIKTLQRSANNADPVTSDGISVKLSALHPRYEFSQMEVVEEQLYPRLLKLCLLSREANIGLNIDAEETDRLEPSLSLFERLAFDPKLAGWDGLGFVVQAYQKRATAVVDWLLDLAKRSRHRLMVRLVKGAYWDTEIKQAQIQGLREYPVFTRKAATDLCYLVCAQKMLGSSTRIYPQFATHNARTVSSILSFTEDGAEFEFQCLHGMGESLYKQIVSQHNCRIYAPVGEHKNLLAYLARRLLENGANTSFLNLLADKTHSVDEIIADPVEILAECEQYRDDRIPLPKNLFGKARDNSSGASLTDSQWLDSFYANLDRYKNTNWIATPLLADESLEPQGHPSFVLNPARQNKPVGVVHAATTDEVGFALETAHKAWQEWSVRSADARALNLEKAANLLEENRNELMAFAVLEAGKTLIDALAEVREAVDFLRYYAQLGRRDFASPQILAGPTGERNEYSLHGRGVFVCISPWNFPLAIFIGQVSAALMAGNTVLAKPAKLTPLVAFRAVKLLHQAGVPREVLQLLPGSGKTIGGQLTSDPRVAGVAFTGGIDTARIIHHALTNREHTPVPCLIAETGGVNAMIVDSSALAEQVVRDVLVSAFQSAGQRCSALRVLYLQEEIADSFIAMIKGAMEELRTGDPLYLNTDIGPIIDKLARQNLWNHVKKLKAQGKAITVAPDAITKHKGVYFPPVMIEINDIAEIEKEVFGPVLHVIRYQTNQLDVVIDAINKTGYGLTLGIHSRIDSTIHKIRQRARVGNIYVNRNMIGAVVGVQPFGGEGLSGTGPKAGGVHYLQRFAVERTVSIDTTASGGNASLLTLN